MLNWPGFISCEAREKLPSLTAVARWVSEIFHWRGDSFLRNKIAWSSTWSFVSATSVTATDSDFQIIQGFVSEMGRQGIEADTMLHGHHCIHGKPRSIASLYRLSRQSSCFSTSICRPTYLPHSIKSTFQFSLCHYGDMSTSIQRLQLWM